MKTSPTPTTHPAIAAGALVLIGALVAWAWTDIWQIAVTGAAVLAITAILTTTQLKR